MGIKDSCSTTTYRAEKECERSLDMTIMDSSSTINYHLVDEWKRSVDMGIMDSSSAVNCHIVKEWERSLDLSIMDSSSTTNNQCWVGMVRSESPYDGTQIELALMQGQRTNPFLTIEMPHNEEQHQGPTMGVE